MIEKGIDQRMTKDIRSDSEEIQDVMKRRLSITWEK